MAITETLVNYKIESDVYEGPLDLLLDLIQNAELDITALSLTKVTDQFLNYINDIDQVSAENLSEFLVIAAKLIQIKSEALLPRPTVREEGEEDLGEELARQLRIYREIKNTSGFLKLRIENNKRTYLHIAKTIPANIHVDMSNISLEDLINSLKGLYSIDENLLTLGTVISIPKITIRRKAEAIINTLINHQITTFSQILGSDNSRLNVIVVFLAVLELIKQDYIYTQQNGLFSDIEIKPTKNISGENSFEISPDD